MCFNDMYTEEFHEERNIHTRLKHRAGGVSHPVDDLHLAFQGEIVQEPLVSVHPLSSPQ